MNPKQELDVKLATISRTYDVDLLLALKTHPVNSSRRFSVDSLPLPLFQISTRMGSPFSNALERNVKSILESIWFVDKYIADTQTKNVLELGAGSNGGSLYLAWKYPKVHFSRLCSFEGKLIHELKKYRGVSNYKSIPGTFDKLDMFDDDSFGVLFSVETLSLSEDREKVLDGVWRVLNPGGYYVVVDGYLGKAPGALTREELITRHLVGRGKSLKEFETYDDFLAQSAAHKFNVVFEADVSEQALPALAKYEHQADLFFRFPLMSKLGSVIFSSAFAYNMISNYIMPAAVKMKMALYKVTVLKK